MSKGCKKIWPVIAWISPLLPALAYFRGNWETFFTPYGVAVISGVFGIIYVLNAVVLSTRIRFVDRMFGHDRIIRFHTGMAAVALVLILTHWYLNVSGVELIADGQIILGGVSLTVFASLVLIAVLFMGSNPVHRLGILRRFNKWLTSSSDLDYSKLKLLHNLLPLAAMAAIVYVMLSSEPFLYSGGMVIMGLYALTAMILYVRFNIVRPLLLGRRGYSVTDIRNLGGDITEIRLGGDEFKFKAGQFAYWSFKSRAVGGEEHPFFISTSPTENEIGFGAKIAGDFTAELPGIRLGDKAVVDGPYGNFILPGDDSIPVLLIAGGIGITPFRSMVQYMADKHSRRHATLVWGVGGPEDLVYGGDFLQLAKRLPSFRYKPVIEREQEMNGDGTIADFESGRVSRGLIRGLCPDLAESKTVVYFCGPNPMRKKVTKILKLIGVPKSRIRTVRFSFA